MKGGIRVLSRGLLLISILSLTGGCATIGSSDPRDPIEGFNRGVYSFNQTMDKMLFDPISNVYKAITPDFLDKGITNIFSNLNDIAVIVNGILQLKINQALTDTIRLVYNSTAGVLGFFDVSTPIGMPKHDEDFGQTLAVWGISSGPYLMVPFFGPTTLRDATGFVVDRGILSPIFYIDNAEVKAGLLGLNYIDFKADLLTSKKIIADASIDEYEFVKNAYFEKRAAQIGETTEIPDFSE